MKTAWNTNLSRFLKHYGLTIEEYLQTNLVEKVCISRVNFLINETTDPEDVVYAQEADDYVHPEITVSQYHDWLIKIGKK